jgi:hypothetical protein
LNEGLAVYYENAQFKRGPSREIQLHRDRLDLLRAKEIKLVPLAKLVRLEPDEFYANPDVDYSEAWAFVHYLMNTTPANRKLVDALLDSLAGGADPRTAVDRAFDPVDFDALDRELARYIESLGA